MQETWRSRAVSADEAVADITSGMRIFVHGAAATPNPLLEALGRRRDLRDVTIYHLHTTGAAPFADPEHAGWFLSVSLFAGPPVRQAIEEGRADFVPVFLSDIPTLFHPGRIQLDAALLQLSPPDHHVIALPSTAARGTASRISASLRPGAGVVTTRGHVHWVVTRSTAP